MKFFHASDIHLDSLLRNLALDEPEQIGRIRHATRDAFGTLVDRCIEEKVSLLLLVGDLFDRDNPNMQIVRFLRHELGRLDREGIRVVIVKGNHDADNRIGRFLDLPSNAVVLDDARPQQLAFPDLGVAVTGQSFSPGPVTENLALAYPPPLPGFFNIALLHTSLSGYTEHEPYAPCSLNDLQARKYDYWALGHIHKREILSRDPAIIYPGNLQGRNAKETGPKGAMCVEVEGNRIISLDFVPLDVVRWHSLQIDSTGIRETAILAKTVRQKLEEVLQLSDGRPAAVRVTFSSRSSLTGSVLDRPESLRSWVLEVASELSLDDLWIEKVRVERPQERDRPVSRLDSDFAAVLAEVLQNPDALKASLDVELASLRRNLPEELRDEVDSGTASDPSSLLPSLLERLYGQEGLS
ncbi:metallophosphoesterase family protein [Leptospirillum ferriphilum]|jgi:DNA repair exonuclease SbcCD nuclease subunit|uniref:DNA repair exonuclease family protein YhaO n=2 Tax=Leptospirillum TaxID=179 RepID=A0A094YK74_9BACT|nr:DNA repair exonuclease [Leptospirillum ferriphilum]EDZ38867.1 MAG: DNA repair exonuclease [Leptospirillum sp. Group II '5-way CG']KGA93586.1 DNA repair exonuclease family protein YhaO [Leptospirillum ferriphilum]